MNLLMKLLSPAVIGMSALFLSVIWMLRDEKDKTRPILVFALVFNLFYGWLLNVVMGQENGLIPLKYDQVLFRVDESLGPSAASIAIRLQGGWRIPLIVVYELMVPMMIFWYMVNRSQNHRGSVVLAYIAELAAGPIMYTILPACGPIYAFGAKWLDPPPVQANAIRLSGMPNAFPSLHIGTAFVLVLFAQGKLWRGVSLAFLAATAMATVATGEHYVVDLIPGLAFGCFAAYIGHRRFRIALLYLGVVLSWSLAVRFEYDFLIAHALLLRSFAAITMAIAILAVFKEWGIPALRETRSAIAPLY